MLLVYQYLYLCNKCFGLLHQIIRIMLIAYYKIIIITCYQSLFALIIPLLCHIAIPSLITFE